MEIPGDCENKKLIFVNKLLDIYTRNISKIDDKKLVKKNMLKWFNTGINSPYIDKLLISLKDPDSKFPFWWSGFYIENPNKKENPISDMKLASTKSKGYSSLDTLFTSKALKEQNEFWSQCSKEEGEKFNWGRYISESYTLYALRNNPKKIGLFVNKDINSFIKSDYYKYEFDIIQNHYIDINRKIILYIYNLKNNCKYIKNILINKLKDKNIIKIICIKCSKLIDCADKFNILIKKKNKKKKSKRLKNTKKSKTKRRRH